MRTKVRTRMHIVGLSDHLVVCEEKTGIGQYDFDFELNLTCHHPTHLTGRTVVMRCGGIADYQAYEELVSGWGGRLLTPADAHEMMTDIARWLPVFAAHTPRTLVLDELPDYSRIESEFGGSCFLKGHRQTDRHNEAISIIRSSEDHARAVGLFRASEILCWQRIALRKLIDIRVKPNGHKEEYRSFWFRGKCVGIGSYWDKEAVQPEAAALVEQFGRAIGVGDLTPFLVADIAVQVGGDPILIEINDAQESGYAGVPPRSLWENVLKIGLGS